MLRVLFCAETPWQRLQQGVMKSWLIACNECSGAAIGQQQPLQYVEPHAPGPQWGCTILEAARD